MICTPKVRHFWRRIFLWVKQDEKTGGTRQNSELLLKIIQGEHLKLLVTVRNGSKNIHSLFFNNGDFIQNHIKVILAFEITVDIKIGRRNDFECLKFGGEEKFPVYIETP